MLTAKDGQTFTNQDNFVTINILYYCNIEKSDSIFNLSTKNGILCLFFNNKKLLGCKRSITRLDQY
jgi:hypothetical protein